MGIGYVLWEVQYEVICCILERDERVCLHLALVKLGAHSMSANSERVRFHNS